MSWRLALYACLLAVAAAAPGRTQDVTELKQMMLRPLAEIEVDPRPPVPVVTRGWGHSDFGRLVFDWNEPVTFTAKIVGNQLRVSFDRPMKTKFDDAQKKLARFFQDIRLSGDDRVVSANLKGYYSVRSFSNENAVVIDLIPEAGPTGEAEEDPDAWLRKLPVVPVRAGEHPGFGRLVFDWSGDVGYELEREGNFVRIRFDRPARIDLSRIAAALPGRVSATTSETKKSEVFVALMVAPEAEIRHFRDGAKIAVDIVAPPPPPKPVAEEPKIAEPEQQRRARTSTKAVSGDGQHAKKDDAKNPAAAGTPLSLSKEALRAQRAAELDRRRSEKKFKGAPLVTVEAVRRGPALDISFNWRKPVAAAVYRRGEYVWVLFDDRARFGLGSLRAIGEGMIDDVEQTDAGDMSLMRMHAPEHLLPTVRHNGTIWSVRLAPSNMTSAIDKPVQITTESDAEGRATLLLGARGLERPQVFRDRNIGDVIHVYPVSRPGVGNRIGRRLVDIEVLSSAIGVAVVPRGDGIRFVRSGAGVHVTSPRGLSISRATDIEGRTVERRSAHLLSDLAEWAGTDDEEFEAIKHRHFRRILVAPDAQRNTARLNLARFYLARGMAADAMGVIEVVLKGDAALEERPGLRALRGAAHYLLGHYALAAVEFDHDGLKTDPSVAPWRAGIAAARGDWLKAYQIIRDSGTVVAGMPRWMRTTFRMIGAEAALAVKDVDTAKSWLDSLRSASLRGENEQYLRFLSAHAMRLEGKLGIARSIWGDLVETGTRRVRSRARFALINAEYETGTIKREDAIEQLEKLSFAWRGDAFEYDLKRRLGDLYSDAGDYRTALMRLRQAASHFKDVDGAEAIAEDMRKRFRMLFLEGGADKLEPVRALALYEEFRELTPPGEEGDEMVRKLADRLVRVDLLSEAARLLDHQVRFRLTGLERSRVGSRLALINMLDRSPEKALDALKLSDGAELPTDLELQRRYLKVRALGATGDVAAALELLDGDVSHDAELLRLEIHWNKPDWSEVARTVRRLIPQRSVAALSVKEGDLVLRWAVALTMQNDVGGLLALRDRFGTAMAKTRYGDAFKAIAGVEIGQVPDFRTLVARIGDLGDFQTLMAGYRDKIHSNALSTIN